MKKTILMLMIAAITTTAVSAQSAPQRMDRRGGTEQPMRSPEDRAGRQTDMMAKRLNLTDAQRKAVYDANLTKAKQMQPLMDGVKGGAKQIKAQYEETLRQTLTSDQFAQYEAMKQERKARRMRRMDKMGNAPQNGYQSDDNYAPVR